LIEYQRWDTTDLEYIIKKPYKYYVIALFTDVCSSCESGNIIQILNSIFQTTDKIFALAIMKSDFSIRDIERLRKQLGLNIPIIAANSILSQKWEYFINKYRQSELTNIVFVVGEGNEIIEEYDSRCNCWKYFYQYLESIKFKRE